MKKLEKRIVTISEEISEINSRLAKMPEGYLLYHKSGNTYKYYQKIRSDTSPNGKRIYINKKHLPLAEELAAKKYLQLRLQKLKREKSALEKYLLHIKKNQSGEEVILKTPAIARLIPKEFQPRSKELQEWANENFTSTASNKEGLMIKAPHGYVRSKSELLIAMELSRKRIPYRYESDFVVGGVTLHPDFVIRHPETGETYLWEHFGLMDNPSYAHNAYNKIQTYGMENFVPSINFIMTFETASNPLDIEYVDMLIEYYFCD